MEGSVEEILANRGVRHICIDEKSYLSKNINSKMIENMVDKNTIVEFLLQSATQTNLMIRRKLPPTLSVAL